MIDKDELSKALSAPLNFALYFEEEGFLKPHYYIILPAQNRDEIIVLAMITSQIEKIQKLYKNDENGLNSLIYVDETCLSFLIKGSVIDCNSPRRTTIDKILSLPKLKLIENIAIPAQLIRDIAQKISGSKKVRPNIKKAIDLSKLFG